MRRLVLVVLLLGLGVYLGASGGVRADGPGGSRLTGDTVVALDRHAGGDERDLAAARTAVELVAGRQDGGSIAFVVYGLQASEPRRVAAGEAGVDAAAEQALAGMREGATSRASDQFQALAASLSYLSGIEAPAGSRVFLVTNGAQAGGLEGVGEGLASLAGLFAERGWSVSPVMLPSATPEGRGLLEGLAAGPDGAAYDMGTAEGIGLLARDVAGFESSGAIEAGLSKGAPVLAAFEVPPRTEHLTVSFVRQDPGVEISVFNPVGGAVTEALVTVEAFETPHTLTYRIVRPVAGKWSVRAEGPGSMVTAGVDVVNPLRVVLVEQAPLVAGAMGLLEAAVEANGRPEPLSGAYVEAVVSQPDGSTRVYRLEDRGLGGDKTAADGVFSTALPASEAQGVNDVRLELRWVQYGAAIRGGGTFRTEAFPVVSVEAVEPDAVEAGGTVTVARARVTAGGYPYMVLPEAVEAVVVHDGEPVAAEAVPRGVMDAGRAWEFQVRAQAPASGRYYVDVSVAGEHVGRAFTARAPQVAAGVEVIVPPAPVSPVALAAGAEPAAGFLGLRVWAWGVIGAGAVALAGMAVRWALQCRPYGYLYDDRGRLVVDFARLGRRWLRRLVAKNRVAGGEVPGLLLRGGTFLFSKGNVVLRYRGAHGDAGFRVNSRPAGTVTRLGEDVWLGIGGRLMRFALVRKLAPAPGAGD